MQSSTTASDFATAGCDMFKSILLRRKCSPKVMGLCGQLIRRGLDVLLPYSKQGNAGMAKRVVVLLSLRRVFSFR